MDSRPYVLDNLDPARRHAEALAYLVADLGPQHPLAVATGYVNLDGLHHLATLADGRPVRLLIGAEPGPGLGAPSPLGLFEAHRVRLREERDLSRFPPSRAAERLRAVESWLDRPEVQVRRFVEQFLHGKAYLFGAPPDARAALITSANLTGAGLWRNLELGVTDYSVPVANDAVGWFDGLWERAQDYEEDLRALLFPDPGLIDPQTVYLRALLELQEPPLDDADRVTRPTLLQLAPFQRHGYERARVICERHGGVVYADGVGTGKTEIGLAFIEERTKESGVYALVVAPAQLAKRWQERIVQTKLPAQVISFNELAADEQLAPDVRGARRVLHNTKDAYRLVIVDEAHALRNEDTTWYRAMERLLGGSRKELVLLTATPINNGLWDLYNLVMLFARHDRAFATHGIDSIRELFLRAGANERDPEALDPDVLFPLADAVSVRRDRTFIEAEYAGQQFADGTPVRFPTPRLTTRRYDLDSAHPGLVDQIATAIDALTMARYTPSAFELDTEERSVEVQLAGLLRSGVLKRFESCWAACLSTVERMLAAHDAFLAAWGQGIVLSGDVLREASQAGIAESAMAGWVADVLPGDDGARPASRFDPEYAIAVAADRSLLAAMRDALAALRPEDDPKLAALVAVLEQSSAQKVAVFATYGATVRYLDDHLPDRLGGRERVIVIGGESTPDERTRVIARFTPDTVVRPGYEPPDGQVDLLLSTDVLSEGQNLQQAQAVVSYDMPWNPQRVVQRNGRVIRLRSPHDEVLLTTMLPEKGDLERLLGLEARIQSKIVAAGGVYGMESEVIESDLERELRTYAERLADGDAGLLDEGEVESGAFVGEQLRRLLERAVAEGEIDRIRQLPWGIGACFRQTPDGSSVGAPGIFFAVRTPATDDEPEGRRYWRYVEFGDQTLVSGDLEILRRIDPTGGLTVADALDAIDLERAWALAAEDIIEVHNLRADVREDQEAIGPRQRWALDVLRDPGVAYAAGADEAEEALSVGRSSAVRRELGAIEADVRAGNATLDDAATRIVDVVGNFGLRAVAEPVITPRLEASQLGVVCWMAVLVDICVPG
ncbi:MAG: helicase-related protein [Solirubrobacteraceae bacterium]